MSAAAPRRAYRQITDLAEARPGRAGNSKAVLDVFTRRRQRCSATRPAGVPTVAPPVGANEPLSKVAEHGTPQLPCDPDLTETDAFRLRISEIERILGDYERRCSTLASARCEALVEAGDDEVNRVSETAEVPTDERSAIQSAPGGALL